ncbi:MAG TPA: NFACT RNA binding domain-containing protein, partial [Chryseosolibacter sp.]
AAADLKSLRNLKLAIGSEQDKTDAASTPFHEFHLRDFRILVGKNAQNNDLLTFKHSYKEDLWLHAKDVSGSHVLIKFQAGKQFPKDVIEYAASLAAFNSKRKTDTLCPVIVTPKKFVRKRKGDPAGAVVVEREKIVMVEPLKTS